MADCPLARVASNSYVESGEESEYFSILHVRTLVQLKCAISVSGEEEYLKTFKKLSRRRKELFKQLRGDF